MYKNNDNSWLGNEYHINSKMKLELEAAAPGATGPTVDVFDQFDSKINVVLA